MSAFLTDLFVEKLILDTSPDKRGTWILSRKFRFRSDILKAIISVPAGFKTDFASVPRIPVAFLLAGDTGHEAAVIHDWLYTTHYVLVPETPSRSVWGQSGGPANVSGFDIADYDSHTAKRIEVSREMADAVFREALGVSGETWRAWLMWAGVRLGGSGPYEMDGQAQFAETLELQKLNALQRAHDDLVSQEVA